MKKKFIVRLPPVSEEERQDLTNLVRKEKWQLISELTLKYYCWQTKGNMGRITGTKKLQIESASITEPYRNCANVV